MIQGLYFYSFRKILMLFTHIYRIAITRIEYGFSLTEVFISILYISIAKFLTNNISILAYIFLSMLKIVKIQRYKIEIVL